MDNSAYLLEYHWLKNILGIAMYLKDCLIENVGPIEFLDVSLPFNDDSAPKPTILVGKNGTGKSVFISYIVDALTEFAKISYEDIVADQMFNKSSYFKFVGRGIRE